jgi:hypothetical protein
MLAVTAALGLLVLALGTTWLLRSGGSGDELAVTKALPASRVAKSAVPQIPREPRPRAAADRVSTAPPEGLPDSVSVAAQVAAVRAQSAIRGPNSVDVASDRVGDLSNAETTPMAPVEIQTIHPETARAETIRPETAKAEPVKPPSTSLRLRPSPAPTARESSLAAVAAAPTASAKHGAGTDRPTPDSVSLAESTPSPAKQPEASARPRLQPAPRVVGPAPVSARRVQPAQAEAEKVVRKDRRSESLARETTAVERVDHRGLPNVVVLHTTWHPASDRRSARIRLETTGEVVTLREGDAVSGMVLRQISPSSVLFLAGEVEFRQRVGAER